MAQWGLSIAAVALTVPPSPPRAADAVAGTLVRCDVPTWNDVSVRCWTRLHGPQVLWLAVVVGVALLLVVLLLRVIPLTSTDGLVGTLRRAREQLPLVGRAFRPRIEFQVAESDGEAKVLAPTLQELMIDEMSPTSNSTLFDERLVGDGSSEALGNALNEVRAGAGTVITYILSKLPRERFRIRVQLHRPTVAQVAITAELLDRNGRSLAIRTFTGLTPEKEKSSEDRNVLGHTLLAREVAAWLSHQLYVYWPGSRGSHRRPSNAMQTESYGQLRRGVALEAVGLAPEARVAYHRAIDADASNVSALVNLALLDSRDRHRVELSSNILRDASILVDTMDDEFERTELLVRIRYVQAVAALNALIWKTQGLPINSWRARCLIPGATTAVSNLAAIIAAYADMPSPALNWQAPQKMKFKDLVAGFKTRTVALAAGIAVERELVGVQIPTRAARKLELDEAIRLIASSRALTLADCTSVLTIPGHPLETGAAYGLACAEARRSLLPDQGVGRAMMMVREALAGDPTLRPWALHADGDPAFATLRTSNEWLLLRREFAFA